MTIDRDALRRKATDRYTVFIRPDDLLALLDQLGAAEQRIRDLTQEVRDERGAARDQMEQVRIRDARIKAVRAILDHSTVEVDGWVSLLVSADDIRAALDGDA